MKFCGLYEFLVNYYYELFLIFVFNIFFFIKEGKNVDYEGE